MIVAAGDERVTTGDPEIEAAAAANAAGNRARRRDNFMALMVGDPAGSL